MDYIKNSAQDEPIPKDQPQPPHPPFTTGGGGGKDQWTPNSFAC